MTQHARLAPSKAKRVLLCAAAPDREAQCPYVPGGEAANQGTNAHWLLEQALQEDRWPPACIGDGGPNFIQQLPYPKDGLPPELRDQAHDCFFYVKRRQEELQGSQILPETKVDPAMFTGRNDSPGTADVSIVSIPTEFLEIVDLKTGGTLVDADDPQLRLYGLGKLAGLAYPDGYLPIKTVRLTVYQPKRPGHDTIERSFDISVEDLIKWAHDVWVPAARATDDPNAMGTPTEEGCKYCKAKDFKKCPEYEAALHSAGQLLFQPVVTEARGETVITEVPDPLATEFSVNDLSVDQISRFLEIWPLIKARGKDIEERAFSILNDRKPVPGFKLVEGNSSREWAHDEEEMAKKLKNLKVTKDQVYVSKLRSPAQMQALGLPMNKWKSIQKLIVTKKGKLTLAPANDKRIDAKPAVEFKPVEPAAQEVVATTATPCVDLGFLQL